MKEVQKNIFEKISTKNSVSEEEFFGILKLVAPGTNLRTALEGALQSGRGALIVVENENTQNMFDGGFRIGARFTPQKMIELAKMDGAIVLNKDLKKINYANVLLTPNSKIKTVETGTRHKAAERTAKQSETLVIAISERKNEITLYYKNVRYPLIETGELLRRANEHIQLLEKQRKLFDGYVEKLNNSEIKSYFDLKLAVQLVQKGRLIQKIVEDLKKYSIELGGEATLIKISLREIYSNVEKETDLAIEDYSKIGFKKSREILDVLSYNEILSDESIVKSLGYENTNYLGGIVKGWRILSKTSLTEEEIFKLVSNWSIKDILTFSEEDFNKLFEIKSGESLKKQIEKIKSPF